MLLVWMDQCREMRLRAVGIRILGRRPISGQMLRSLKLHSCLRLPPNLGYGNTSTNQVFWVYAASVARYEYSNVQDFADAP